MAEVRLAVRRTLAGLGAAGDTAATGDSADPVDPVDPGGRALVLVACSGGADSLALAAAAAHEAPSLGLRAGAVVVDHGLQDGSDSVAAHAAQQCSDLGLAPVDVERVRVQRDGSGPEASSRKARYAALLDLAGRHGAQMVLVGHTRDDQAEQVLLGLARGSGARSLSGMPRRRGLFHRPLLDVGRATTEAACATLGLEPWHDPHNQDPAYRRVRARRLLSSIEAELGPGIGESLARSADLLRQDSEALEAMALRSRAELGDGPLDVAAIAALPDAIRTRVWRAVAIEAGSPPGSLFSVHVHALDALVLQWHGQGPIQLPGRVQARRCGPVVRLEPAGPVE